MNIESTAQSAPTTHREPISRSLIRGVFLRNGFRIEDGRDDLPDCVYEAAFDLLEAVGAPAVQGEPVEGLPAMMKIEHHSPGITIEKDFFGTVHIKLGDFDYIQIQYQNPHTDNARQLRHATLIADVLAGTSPQPAPDVAGLVEALEQAGLVLHEMDEGHAALVDIDNALAAYYRKEGEA